MKKIIFLILTIFLITGCKNDALAFKEEYESLNGKENMHGAIHREIEIPSNNPYIKVEPEKVVDMLKNNETFYLYVGDPLCPWCRSVLEKAIEVSNAKNIKKIYYIEIWDDEGNEIFRDQYKLIDGEVTKVLDGTESYKTLLESFNDLLSDYTLTNENGEKVPVSEKRIFAPTFFYVEDGKLIRMTTGISSLQTDSRGELTEEILKDEETKFQEFFIENK